MAEVKLKEELELWEPAEVDNSVADQIETTESKGVQTANESCSSLVQMKEEPVEFSIKQEPLQEFPFIRVIVKSEDESSVLHQTPTEESREETNGAEPGLDKHSESEKDSSDTDDSEEWTGPTEQTETELTEEQWDPPHFNKGKTKQHKCSECGNIFHSKYRICLFGDGQTSVVPISWIFDDNGTFKCRWTSSLSNIKNNSPPNPNWKGYDIVKIVGPSIGDYDQANQYISDYTTGVSAAEDSITYSMTDPALVELPEKRKRKNKLCDESDINLETSSCEDDMNLKQSGNEVKQSGLKSRNVPLPKPPIYHDTLQRSGETDEDDPKPTSSDVSEFHDLQQHHMTYKEMTVQTRIPDDVHLKKSRNAMKRVGLKTKNVQLAKTPRYHGDCLDDNNESPDDSYLNSSQPSPVFLGREPKETKCKVTMEKLFDLNTKILQQIQTLEQRQAVIMTDLAKVKSVLMKRAEEDAHEELFKQQCSSFETFEAFCQRLEEDRNYRELYEHYLIHTHGSSNIGELVRQALKSIASDNVLCLYNRTGKDGKKVLPPVLLTCLKKCVRSFHKQSEIEVKKLKVTTRTTPDAECIRQVEIFLSNANTRLKRKPKKGKS